MAGVGEYPLRGAGFNLISQVRVGSGPRHPGCLLHGVSNDTMEKVISQKTATRTSKR